MILRLGEIGAVRLLVTSHVLEEIDRVLRRKTPEMLGTLVVLLDRSRIEVLPSPGPEVIEKSRTFVDHTGDSQVVAAAWEAGVDYLVTLDREHLLGNEPLKEAMPFPVGTPGDFLAWFRAQLP